MKIPTRNNPSRKIPELDSLYVYSTGHKIKFTHRQQVGEYAYLNHGAIEKSAEAEIHIYHRTVEIKGVKQGLTMVTKQGKVREVQKWFNEQIKHIESDSKLFDTFSHAKASPTELGLHYGH